jgi:2'-5' RNA ligase
VNFIRSFVCVRPPADVACDIARWISGLGRFRDYRWVSREQIHITLRFLGEAEPSLVQKMDTALSQIGGVGEFGVRLSGSGGFPSVSSPRVLWLGVTDGADDLARLASRVERAARNADFAPDPKSGGAGKNFKAHLTLARSKTGTPLPKGLALALRDGPAFSWRCRSFILMKSVLEPEGAVHTPMREYPLA